MKIHKPLLSEVMIAVENHIRNFSTYEVDYNIEIKSLPEGDNKFHINDIAEIEHCIKFNKEIGYEVVHLIGVLNQTNEPETIHLDGDYRTLIPMKFIEKGITLTEFEKYLIAFLRK